MICKRTVERLFLCPFFGPLAQLVRAGDSSTMFFELSFLFSMVTCVSCGKALCGQRKKYCSNACKQRCHYHRVKKQPNTYYSQTMRALRRKLSFVLEMGGCCTKCGYDANLAALQFHHLDASQKEIQLDARRLSNTRVSVLRAELSKCVLLCANCHIEVHHPEHTKASVQRIIAGDSARKLADANRVNSGKPNSHL